MFRNYSNYEIFEDGRIWSYWTNKFLKPGTNQYGYKQVCLVDNEGQKKRYMVHRVVWEAVTGEPIPSNMEINHISENKTENMISNLELVSHKENCNFGTRNSRVSKSQRKQVGAYRNGELIMTFKSLSEAGRQGFNIGTISMCCNGKRKIHKGYEWRYI